MYYLLKRSGLNKRSQFIVSSNNFARPAAVKVMGMGQILSKRGTSRSPLGLDMYIYICLDLLKRG